MIIVQPRVKKPELDPECEATVFNLNRVDYFLQVGSQSQPQREEFEHLCVLFTNYGRLEEEMDKQTGVM